VLPDKTWIRLQEGIVSVRPQAEQGLFKVDLNASELTFTDSEDNRFCLRADGTCSNSFANPIVYNQDEERPSTPAFTPGEMV
jgi:hypothetical protein